MAPGAERGRGWCGIQCACCATATHPRLLVAPEVERQRLVCQRRAGHSVPGSFGLHLPLLVRCGEWLTQRDGGNYLLLPGGVTGQRTPQGLYLSGVIGDRVNLRYVLCFGLCGSAAVVSSRVAVALRPAVTPLLTRLCACRSLSSAR